MPRVNWGLILGSVLLPVSIYLIHKHWSQPVYLGSAYAVYSHEIDNLLNIALQHRNDPRLLGRLGTSMELHQVNILYYFYSLSYRDALLLVHYCSLHGLAIPGLLQADLLSAFPESSSLINAVDFVGQLHQLVNQQYFNGHQAGLNNLPEFDFGDNVDSFDNNPQSFQDQSSTAMTDPTRGSGTSAP